MASLGIVLLEDLRGELKEHWRQGLRDWKTGSREDLKGELGWFSWVGVVCLGWVCEDFVVVRGFGVLFGWVLKVGWGLCCGIVA